MKFSDTFENIGVKLVCLLLAIVVWLYANQAPQIPKQGERSSITFQNVPVQLKNPKKGQSPKPEKISLEVEFMVAKISTDTFRVMIRLTDMDKTKGRVTLTANNVELPEGMSFVKAEPHEIRF